MSLVYDHECVTCELVLVFSGGGVAFRQMWPMVDAFEEVQNTNILEK